MPERPALLLFVGAALMAVMMVVLVFAFPGSSATFGPIAVEELAGGGPPNTAGPTIYLTVQNAAGSPIVALSAIVHLNWPYAVEFPNVSASNPFEPGGTTSTSRILVGGGFSCPAVYNVTFLGAYSSGSRFNESLSVPLVCYANGGSELLGPLAAGLTRGNVGAARFELAAFTVSG